VRCYVDADILIWHLRYNPRATDFLDALRHSREYELWVSAAQRGEVLFHMRPDEEEMTLGFLSLFSTAPIDQRVIDHAATLYWKWHPSHGIDANDAILAATAIETGGKIFCLNTKHYPMPDVIVEKAW
jgi:predicted nucleic acid-binding protein